MSQRSLRQPTSRIGGTASSASTVPAAWSHCPSSTGGVALALKLTAVCGRLRQCRSKLNVIVHVGRHTLSLAFLVPLPGKEAHWQSQWHTD
jgi:hypothetical protein